MTGTVSAVAAINGGNKKQSTIYNLTTLKKWSIVNNRIPNVENITHIHVYDFDNTLFASPLPNRQLWTTQSIGQLQLQDLFHGGGWWHDPDVLAMTGEGIDKEEPRAWEGWWNENIVDLVKISMQQTNALTVLLTGRAQGPFDDLIRRMVKSKKLEFDLICLKPDVTPTNETVKSTMKFKQAFLAHLVQVYKSAEEMRVYEDRLHHVEQFRTFFADLNSKYPLDASAPSDSPRNKPINTEVVEVVSMDTTLDPADECFRIKEMARMHNDKVRAGELPGKKQSLFTVKKQVYYTAYLIQPEDSKRLLAIANLGDYGSSKNYSRYANSIIITARHNVPAHVLQKVGGLGATLRWKVIALGSLDDKVIAARLQPVPLTASFYVEASVPHVLLATSGYPVKTADSNRIQTWVDVPEHQQIEFDTRVGEKAALRLEEERFNKGHQSQSQGQQALNNNGKRPRAFDQDKDFPALPKPGGGGGGRNFGSTAGGGGGNSGGGRNNRGGGPKHDGGGGGKGGNNRQGGGSGKGGPPRGPANGGKKGGRGNFANYRSLDDVGAGGAGGGGGGHGGAGGSGIDGATDDGGLSY